MTHDPQSISLCIVAVNESAFIGSCIKSARQSVDEIIVLDTGSNDGTQDVARHFGAQVVCIKYPGDQASAFNLLLDYPQGDWILILDGDEVLDSAESHQIRTIIQNPDIDGYIFTIRNYRYFPDTRWRWADQTNPITRGGRGYLPSRTVRLFRNHRGFRYSGHVHQNIYHSILKNGGRIENCNIPIHHCGHLRLSRLTWKIPRFLKMQQQQINDEPDNPRGLVELGVNHLAAGNILQAIAAFKKGKNLGYGAGASFFLGKTFLLKGDPKAALTHLDEAILKYSKQQDIDFDLADAWELKGRAWRESGERLKAEHAYITALSFQENHPVALNDLAVLLNLKGDYRGAEKLLQGFIKQFPGFDIPWSTLGITRFNEKKLDEAQKAFLTALDINPGNTLAKVNLAAVYEQSGKRQKAENAYKIAREGLDRATAKVLGLKGYSPHIRIKTNRQKRAQNFSPLIHIISHISGNRGQMLINILKCLNDHPQTILCGDAGSYSGLGLREEIEELGNDVRIITSRDHLQSTLRQLNPRIIIDHLPHGFFSESKNSPSCIRIAVGHFMLPMPEGYDAYLVFSERHARLQSHLPPEKIHIIPGCIDLDSFQQGDKPNRTDNLVKIAMISDLDPGRFPRHILAYLPPLNELNAQVFIAGRGARRHEIKPELSSFRLDQTIHFVGPVPWKRISEFLLNADIGLHLPETHEEAFSVSVLHMLAAGLPVVSKPWGNIPDLVTQEKNGYLAENEEKVANRLKECSLSAELRNRMGRSSRQNALKYDINKVGVLYRKLIKALSPVHL